ncbi:hypothetical protein KPH14_011488 [Odynerus spinipes]|uniref:MaoC-like domain-containing protein n=1 Tax=Odynerus spinipes TaxID=1348599 RepID=A0AAD9RVV3_9HYME|nr:hypothetical protein KPH14_011488 [Odynerus spinipes]
MLRVSILYHIVKKYFSKTPTETCSTGAFKGLKKGDQVSIFKTITNSDVLDFARLTKDYNPIHINSTKNIVHGALLNGLVSGVLGTKLPGPGTIVAEQILKFPNPCYVGDTVEIIVQIISVRKIVKCEYNLIANEDRIVLKGEAKLIIQTDKNNLK